MHECRLRADVLHASFAKHAALLTLDVKTLKSQMEHAGGWSVDQWLAAISKYKWVGSYVLCPVCKG